MTTGKSFRVSPLPHMIGAGVVLLGEKRAPATPQNETELYNVIVFWKVSLLLGRLTFSLNNFLLR